MLARRAIELQDSLNRPVSFLTRAVSKLCEREAQPQQSRNISNIKSLTTASRHSRGMLKCKRILELERFLSMNQSRKRSLIQVLSTQLPAAVRGMELRREISQPTTGKISNISSEGSYRLRITLRSSKSCSLRTVRSARSPGSIRTRTTTKEVSKCSGLTTRRI